MKYLYLYIWIFCSLGIALQAQNTTSDELDHIRVVTKDGNVFTGKLIESDTEKMTIETESLGTITLEKATIESVNRKGESSQGSLSYLDDDIYNSTRYLINSSGFTLKKGQKYYENIAVFFSTFAFGLSDRFTISVGSEIATLLFDQRFPILYIAPKFGAVQSENFNISLGATYFNSPSGSFNGLGAITTAFTFGNRNSNFTIGPGLGYTIDNGFGNDLVIPINLAFMKRFTNRFSLVSDSYAIFYDSDTSGIISLAARFHFKSGAAFNAGLWKILEDTDDIFALPFVSALIPIGKNR